MGETKEESIKGIIRPFSLLVSLMIVYVAFVLALPCSVKAAVFDVPPWDAEGLNNAIIEAETNGEDDTINLAPGIYTLTNPLPSITSTIEISGAVAIIERDHSAAPFRIFHVDGGDLILKGVIIRNGLSTEEFPGVPGGGILNSGGTMVIKHCMISDNVAFAGGGGIANLDGTMTIKESLIYDNSGTLSGFGGGILNSGTLKLVNSTLRDNIADVAGGIGNQGTMNVNNCTISHNNGIANDGGIFNSGTLDIKNSNISNNGAGVRGGINNTGIMTVKNCTISNNGGSLCGGISNSGTLTIRSSTISNNSSGISGGIANHFNGSVDLKNTIIAHNSPNDCSGTVPVTTSGYNLDSDGTCSLNGPGDLSAVDPLLGPLASNGGPTMTRALMSGSPAIDAGSEKGFPPFDQRGVRRPIDGDGDGEDRCDIGAYEFEP